jgi:hypothetical protein
LLVRVVDVRDHTDGIADACFVRLVAAGQARAAIEEADDAIRRKRTIEVACAKEQFSLGGWF